MKLVDLNTVPQEKASRENDIDQLLEALPDDHTALQLGQALYRCRSLPWRDRWHIGKHILQFESPKLGVTVAVNEQDFATLLDQRIKKWDAMQNGKQIEQTQVIESSQVIEPTDIRPPHPITNDRRFRRL